MEYGVLACAHCRRAQVVELRFQRVRCKACHETIQTAAGKSYYRGVDEAEARRVLQRVTAQLGGMPLEDYARVLAAQEKESPGSVEAAIESLRGEVDFSSDEFEEALRRLRVPGSPRRHLEGLVGENRVFEPRPGRFRLV